MFRSEPEAFTAHHSLYLQQRTAQLALRGELLVKEVWQSVCDLFNTLKKLLVADLAAQQQTQAQSLTTQAQTQISSNTQLVTVIQFKEKHANFMEKVTEVNSLVKEINTLLVSIGIYYSLRARMRLISSLFLSFCIFHELCLHVDTRHISHLLEYIPFD